MTNIQPPLGVPAAQAVGGLKTARRQLIGSLVSIPAGFIIMFLTGHSLSSTGAAWEQYVFAGGFLLIPLGVVLLWFARYRYISSQAAQIEDIYEHSPSLFWATGDPLWLLALLHRWTRKKRAGPKRSTLLAPGDNSGRAREFQPDVRAVAILGL